MKKINEFFKKNQDKLILTIGAILIATTSFAAGRISNNKQDVPIEVRQNVQQQEIKTEQAQLNANIQNIETQKQKKQKSVLKNQKQVKNKFKNPAKITETVKDGCEFVASSRGHKYYKANSSSAKNLSEKNKICFPSENEAIKAGYEPSASLK